MDRLKRSRGVRFAVGGLILVVTMTALFGLARQSSPHELLHAVRCADPWLLVFGVLPALALNQLARLGRYAHLLRGRDGDGPRSSQVLSAVFLSQAANNVLPLRAGEAIRTRETVLLGVPLAKVVSAQLLEKVIELAVIVLVVAPVFALEAFRRLPAAPVAICAVALAVAVVLLARLRGRHPWLARATDWSRGEVATSIAWALAADVAEVLVVALAARAVGLPLGVGGSIAVLGAVNLAILLPSAPANLGTLECGAVLALLSLGAPREGALAFAIVYRVVQFLPITLAGAAIVAVRGLPAFLPRRGSAP